MNRPIVCTLALAIATVIFEMVGGALLVFGLATPLVGLGMAVMNVAIILTTRADGGFYVHEGGWEYNAVLAAIGLLFLAFGSGRQGRRGRVRRFFGRRSGIRSHHELLSFQVNARNRYRGFLYPWRSAQRNR